MRRNQGVEIGATTVSLLLVALFLFGFVSPPMTGAEANRKADAALQKIVLEPQGVHLAHPQATQRLVVTGYYADGTAHDVSAQCRYVSSSPEVLEVSQEGVLKALAPGQAVIEARLGAARSKIEVRVADQPAEVSINFSQDLLSIFTQKSCNSPSCHGAIAGQNGFKLSLFGYDPEADHQMIVKAHDGRRVNLQEPEQSLILLKPSMSVLHGGGERLPRGSPEYQTLSTWLGQGAQYNAQGPRVVDIAIYPKERILAGLGSSQRWAVVGRLSDGTTRDMSREVRYQVGDETVVTVTPEGTSTAAGVGQSHVMVRATGRVAVARVGVVDEPPFKDYPVVPVHNFIDEALIRQWRQLNLVPSALSSDEEFVRRVYLDAIGLLPTSEERERFLQDPREDKRSRLIDELLAGPEYAAHWTGKFEDSFRNHPTTIQSRAQGALRRYIYDFLNEDRPYDQVVREILTSMGDQTLDPAVCFWTPMANYHLNIPKVNQITTTVSRLFLGLRMECVECHNHPLENLTQNDFFDLSAFFGKMRIKQGYDTFRRVWYLDPERQFLHPQTKQPLQAVIPFDRSFPVRRNGDQRKDLARWITSPENPYFARAIVNRIWREYFNVGIVEPFDDFRTTNPPSNEGLLDGLAEHLVDHGFRLKSVHQAILNSRAYQLTSVPHPGNKLDNPRFFTHYNVRILPAEALLDALSQVMGVEHSFDLYPKGTRAQDINHRDYPGYFLDVFGFLNRLSLEERSKKPSLSQALHMMFGDTVMDKLQSDENVVSKLLESGKSDEEINQHLLIRAYSRKPISREKEQMKQYVATMSAHGIERKKIHDDLLWVVVNSKEFLVNH